MSLGTQKLGTSRSASEGGGAARLGFAVAFSLYVGLLVYCLLSLFLGPAGISAYGRLEERKEAMLVNLDRLGSIRAALDAELESLKSDPERAALEARSLGYLRKGETILLLDGRREGMAPLETGKVLPFAQPASLDDATLKGISLGLCLAMMAFLVAPRRNRQR